MPAAAVGGRPVIRAAVGNNLDTGTLEDGGRVVFLETAKHRLTGRNDEADVSAYTTPLDEIQQSREFPRRIMRRTETDCGKLLAAISTERRRRIAQLVDRYIDCQTGGIRKYPIRRLCFLCQADRVEQVGGTGRPERRAERAQLCAAGIR